MKTSPSPAPITLRPRRTLFNLAGIRASGVLRSRLARLALLLALSTLPLHGIERYDCEGLATNQLLHGQDGWRVQAGFGQVEVLPGGITDNATIVLRHQHMVTADQPAFATRTNDARFDFVPFTGTETNAIIQFEATGEHLAMFALGCDLNGDGILTADAGELGPAFGVFDRKFRIQEANLGDTHDDNFNLGGGDGNSGNDYYRLQLRLDFTANGGDGLGSLVFKNLTDGDTGFHSVPGVRNQPLGLHRLPPAARPAHWNALWIQLLSLGNSIPSADNFVPNLNGVRIVEATPSGTNLFLRWRGGVGPYQVQRRVSLTEGGWEDVGSPTPLLTATLDFNGVTGFFRVRQP
jgi:hypothetical protein